MIAFKWTGILIAAVTIALDGMANLILATLTPHVVPEVINVLALGVAVVSSMVAFGAHLAERIEHKLNQFIDLTLRRIDDLESRIGDRNSGFVEGYLLGHGDAPELPAPVVPLVPRGAPRRAVQSVDD